MKLNSQVFLRDLILTSCLSYCRVLFVKKFIPSDLFLCFIAAVCVLLLLAKLGDTIGRKPALLINTLGMVVCGLFVWGAVNFNITGQFVSMLLSVIYGAQMAFFGCAYAGIFIRNYETGHKTVSSAAYILSAGFLGDGLFKMLNSELLSKNALVALGILAIIGIWDYFKSEETTEYTAFKNSSEAPSNPLRELTKNYRFEFKTGLVIAIFVIVSFALLSALIYAEASHYELNADKSSLIVWAYIPIMIFVCGKLTDKIDAFKQLQYGIPALIVGGILFGIFHSFVNRLFCFMTLHLFAIAVANSFPICVMRMLPVSCRYSGVTIGRSLGSMIITLPSLAFVSSTRHAAVPTAGQILALCGLTIAALVVSILTLICVRKLSKRQHIYNDATDSVGE